MRTLVLMGVAVALAACGPAATGPEEASAQAAVPASAQQDYVTRCVDEYVAQSGAEARRWAPDQCAQQWQTVVDAGPMADAILAAAPASGAADANALRGSLTAVQWNARPEGTLLAQGRLGAADVQVDRNGPSLNFYWSESGAMIPYDLVGALRARGVEVTMIGCSRFGVGEDSKVYRVTAPGKAPFQLGIYDRMAPTANADSFYNVNTNLSGRVQTLAQLRGDGNDWAATCPQ